MFLFEWLSKRVCFFLLLFDEFFFYSYELPNIPSLPIYCINIYMEKKVIFCVCCAALNVHLVYWTRLSEFLSLHKFTLNWVINRVHFVAYDCDDEYLTILGSLRSCRIVSLYIFDHSRSSSNRAAKECATIAAAPSTTNIRLYYYCHLVYFPSAYCLLILLVWMLSLLFLLSAAAFYGHFHSKRKAIHVD